MDRAPHSPSVKPRRPLPLTSRSSRGLTSRLTGGSREPAGLVVLLVVLFLKLGSGKKLGSGMKTGPGLSPSCATWTAPMQI